MSGWTPRPGAAAVSWSGVPRLPGLPTLVLLWTGVTGPGVLVTSASIPLTGGLTGGLMGGAEVIRGCCWSDHCTLRGWRPSLEPPLRKRVASVARN